MKLVPRAGTWQVHFQDMQGDRQRRSTKVRVNPDLPDRGRALANLAAIDVMRSELMAEIPADMRAEAGKQRTLAYALQYTMDNHWSTKKSANSVRYRVNLIIKDRGYWRLPEITYLMLEDYGRELEQRGDSPATRNRKLSLIQTAMTQAHRRGWIAALPQFPHWKEDNVKERYLSLSEESHLAYSMEQEAAPGDEPRQYMRHLVPFLLDTGLRAGEVSLLGREQDLGDRIWLPHGSTKSGKGRSVPLTPRAREALTWMLDSPFHWELVALRAKAAELPTQRLGHYFHLSVKAAGLKGVTLHTLRHTCASRLVQAGVSLYVVKEWLGHSTITVTERYAHLAPRNMDAGADALAKLQAQATTVAPKATTGTQPSLNGTVH